MFKIADKPQFTHDVPIMVPADMNSDGGGHQEHILRTTFKVLPISEASAFDLNLADGTTGFLKAVIVRFDDVVDGDGKPQTYSEELRDQLIDFHYVRAGLVNAYLRAVMKARMGN